MSVSSFTALTISIMLTAPATSTSDKSAALLSTSYLLSDGWTITRKSEERKTLPGISPYQNLTRILHITRYRLEKGTAVMTCENVYDSQLDHFEESCRDIKK